MRSVSRATDVAARLANLLEAFAGALLFAPPLLLPWLQGGNDARSLWVVAGCVVPGWGLWAALRCGTFRPARVPQWLGIAAGLVVAAAVVHGFDQAVPALDPKVAAHHAALRARWPASFVQLNGQERTLIWLLLGVAVIPWVDLLRRRRRWVSYLLVAHACNGALIASFGLAAGGAHPWLFADDLKNLTGKPFAGFFHYSLAAAYFNTCLPGAVLLAAGIPGSWRSACVARKHGRAMAAWGFRRLAGVMAVGSLMMALADNRALAGQTSGAAAVFLVLAGLVVARLSRAGRRAAAAGLGVGAILLAMACAVIAGWAVLDERVALGRLKTTGPGVEPPALVNRGDLMLPSRHPQRGLYSFERRLAWATAQELAARSRWWGSGPGSWSQVYPRQTTDPFLLSFFLHVQFVHSDPLQYIIEWGWLGGSAWMIILFGAALHGSRRTWKRWSKGLLKSAGGFSELAASAGLVAVLCHSLVDFPLQCPAVLAAALLCSALALSSPSAWDVLWPGRGSSAKKSGG